MAQVLVVRAKLWWLPWRCRAPPFCRPIACELGRSRRKTCADGAWWRAAVSASPSARAGRPTSPRSFDASFQPSKSLLDVSFRCLWRQFFRVRFGR